MSIWLPRLTIVGKYTLEDQVTYSLSTQCINIFDTWKSASDDDSKVIHFSHTSELHVVKGIIIIHGLFLACDCQDFTFRGVKLDVGISRPFIHIWKGVSALLRRVYMYTIKRSRTAPFQWKQLSYRVYSNKRRGAYLIFRATSEALIGGRCLFKNCTRQIYFFYIFIQRHK